MLKNANPSRIPFAFMKHKKHDDRNQAEGEDRKGWDVEAHRELKRTIQKLYACEQHKYKVM